MYDAYPFDPRSGVWTTPALPPPARRLGDRQTCVFPLSRRLAGEWSFLPSPLAGVPSPFAADQDFDFSDALPWQDVLAPACLAMQGFDLENNREYYYRTRVDLPAGCAGKRLLIRFEGVYSNARVWVNGRFLRSHAGGFTPFDCDISDFGDLPFVTLVVGVADLEGDTPGIWNPHGRMQGDPSWASYYAHFNIGGILRPVSLLVLEPCHIAAVIPETVLEKGACRFRLGVTVAVPESGAPKDLVLEQELTDPHGRVVLQNRLAVEERFRLPLRREPARTMDPAPDWCARHPESHAADLRRAGADPGGSVPDKDLYGLGLSQIVPDALLWTAESPFLYTLRLRLTAGGRLLEEVEQAVGLREILYGGAKATAPNRLYVNGKEVKLRGACRHDVSARFGRSMTPEEERREVQAYKRCNLNFVRTSHYPPSEHFLSLCDRYGLYVEVENAACFKGANGVEIHCPPQQFVDAMAETLAAHRAHPSVLIWSLGNESGFEKTWAFRKEYDLVKSLDPTRPVIFSYPETVDSRPRPYDIFSMHYQAVDGALGLPDLPKLHDEFAHVGCYNLETLRRDESPRLAWGESLRQGWDNLFDTDGALGCAVWAAVDDVFLLPGGVRKRHQCHGNGPAAGYGPWGCILDRSQREKPEAFLTRKAFSPVRVLAVRPQDDRLELELYNRFDHTDLARVEARVRTPAGALVWRGCVPASIPPHTKGRAVLPLPSPCEPGAWLEFWHDGRCVEEQTLVQAPDKTFAAPAPLKLTEEVAPLRLIYRSVGMLLEADRMDGTLVLRDARDGRAIFTSAALYRQGMADRPPETVCLEGGLDLAQTGADLLLRRRYPDAWQETLALAFHGSSLRVVWDLEPAGELPAALEKAGLRFCLAGPAVQMDWERRAPYSRYPAGHIGRPAGVARCAPSPGEPDNWAADARDPFLFSAEENEAGQPCRDFRTLRDHILRCRVTLSSGAALELHPADERLSAGVRTEKGAQALLVTVGNFHPTLSWGNFCGRPLCPGDLHMDFTLTLGD